MFKFELKQAVSILISGEKGHVKARAEFVNSINEYQIHYRSADGRAVEGWFQETDLKNVHSNPLAGMDTKISAERVNNLLSTSPTQE